MAQRIELFDVTVPAGTAVAAPISQALIFDQGEVTDFEAYVPPGPSGFMGFAILHSGERILPRTPGKFIIADNDTIRWPLSKYPTGAKWSVTAYNIDVFPHTFQIRLLINETSRGNVVEPPLVDIQQPDQPAPVNETIAPVFSAGTELMV
jgi:hypothetical protein